MVKGFKVFNPDWTCRDFQYEVGKTYEMDGPLIICERGFHFCETAADCFDYYQFDPKNKVAEIIAHGEVDAHDNKSCTNKIEIVREIPWAELLNIVNSGRGNTGNRNTGDWNTGECNTGDWNTGECNTGHWNTGECNTGDWNTGECNTGHCNAGDRNTGYWNTGNRNTGYWNTGNWNQSNFCSGDFNLTDSESGCFCVEKHAIRLFDKESSMTIQEWRESEAFQLLARVNLTQWVPSDDMTDDEKVANPSFETTGGYLKVNDPTSAFQNWWDGLSNAKKTIIKEIPNFDPEKFQKITGIAVEEDD